MMFWAWQLHIPLLHLMMSQILMMTSILTLKISHSTCCAAMCDVVNFERKLWKKRRIFLYHHYVLVKHLYMMITYPGIFEIANVYGIFKTWRFWAMVVGDDCWWNQMMKLLFQYSHLTHVIYLVIIGILCLAKTRDMVKRYNVVMT